MFSLRRPSSPLHVVVGLGNPGREYEGTRHNIGARIVDAWGREARLIFKASRPFKSRIAPGKLENASFLLVLPQTFMNLSGVAVRAVLRKKSAETRRLLLVHDDVALPLGTLRFKQGGGAGGHNGVASVIAHVGSPDFARLRIGVGPRPAGQDLSDFVLGRFSPSDAAAVRAVADAAQQALTLWLSRGTVPCMDRYNG
ncbi:MAG: aminoacyl-tRNA hydrolase [Deltaproteobacteria bacterium]